MAAEKLSLDQEDSSTLYNIEFVFDSDVRCTVKIHYFAAEEVAGGQIMWVILVFSMAVDNGCGWF